MSRVGNDAGFHFAPTVGPEAPRPRAVAGENTNGQSGFHSYCRMSYERRVLAERVVFTFWHELSPGGCRADALSANLGLHLSVYRLVRDGTDRSQSGLRRDGGRTPQCTCCSVKLSTQTEQLPVLFCRNHLWCNDLRAILTPFRIARRHRETYTAFRV